VAELLRRRLPPGDPFAGYPDRLEELFDQQLSGYLVGSLDTVLRVRGSNGVPGYVIADYKTNWLGGVSAETLSAWHYRPQALTEAMLVGHYPLQALLYCVALHRYLRWRQPGYDPDRHLRGVLYLFVRGMCGPDTPRVDSIPCGVFGWQPPSGLIDELSTLLAGSGDDA
jgi:exodeoxyribonuclease V beta subunit